MTTRFMTFGVQYGNPALGDHRDKEPHREWPFVTGNGYVRIETEGFEPGDENDLRLLLHKALGSNRYAFLYHADESRGPTSDRALEHDFYPAGELAVLHLVNRTEFAPPRWGFECTETSPDCGGEDETSRGCPVHTYGLDWYGDPDA